MQFSGAKVRRKKETAIINFVKKHNPGWPWAMCLKVGTGVQGGFSIPGASPMTLRQALDISTPK